MDGSGHKNDLQTKTEKKIDSWKLKGLKVLRQSRDNLAESAFLHFALSNGVKNRTWGCLKNIHIPAYSINSGDYLSCTHTTKLSDVDFWPGFKCGEHVRALEPPKVSTLTAAAREGCFFFFAYNVNCEQSAYGASQNTLSAFFADGIKSTAQDISGWWGRA